MASARLPTTHPPTIYRSRNGFKVGLPTYIILDDLYIYIYNQYFASRTRLERSRDKLRPKTGPKSTQSSCIYIATAPVIPSANTWLHTDSYKTIVQSLERTLGAEPEWASGSERRRGYICEACCSRYLYRKRDIYIERERVRERERERDVRQQVARKLQSENDEKHPRSPRPG